MRSEQLAVEVAAMRELLFDLGTAHWLGLRANVKAFLGHVGQELPGVPLANEIGTACSRGRGDATTALRPRHGPLAWLAGQREALPRARRTRTSWRSLGEWRRRSRDRKSTR